MTTETASKVSYCRLTPTEHAAITEAAADTDVSMSRYMAQAAIEKIERARKRELKRAIRRGRG